MKPKITYNAQAIIPNVVGDIGELGEPWTAQLDGAWFAPDLEIETKTEAEYKRLAEALLEAQVAQKPVTIDVDLRAYSFVPEQVELVYDNRHTIRIWFAPDKTNRLF